MAWRKAKDTKAKVMSQQISYLPMTMKGGKKGRVQPQVEFARTEFGDVDFGTPEKGAKRGKGNVAEEDDSQHEWYAAHGDTGPIYRSEGGPMVHLDKLTTGKMEYATHSALSTASAPSMQKDYASFSAPSDISANPSKSDNVVRTAYLTELELRLLLTQSRLELPAKIVRRWAGEFNLNAFLEDVKLKRLQIQRLEKAFDAFCRERRTRLGKESWHDAIELTEENLSRNDAIEVTAKDVSWHDAIESSSKHAASESVEPSASWHDAAESEQVPLGEAVLDCVNIGNLPHSEGMASEACSDVIERTVLRDNIVGKHCLTTLELRTVLAEARLNCPETSVAYWAPVFDVDAFAEDMQLKRLEKQRLKKVVDAMIASKAQSGYP